MTESQLTELQLAILEVLWEEDEASVQTIHARLAGERGLALSTVATVVARLEKKGILSRRNIGRTFLYSAAIARRDVQKEKLRDLTRTVFQGDKKALMAHLVQPGALSDDELAYVRELLDRAEQEASDE